MLANGGNAWGVMTYLLERMACTNGYLGDNANERIALALCLMELITCCGSSQ
jgi:hypothetical protein